MTELVLSLFPGIGLLDMAFEEQGFCIVRGPDVLWGGDIRRFNPPRGKFDGIIGGPPCQAFSELANIARARWGDDSIAENLIPEFEFCVAAAQPQWFLMENVRLAPAPMIDGYAVSSTLFNARSFGSEQHRVRRFSFGLRGTKKINLTRFIEINAFEPLRMEYAVVATRGGGGAGLKTDRGGTRRPWKTQEKHRRASLRSIERKCELQGLPTDYTEHMPFTSDGKHRVIGNGVPLPMGRAIAKAVRKALEQME